MTQTKGFSFRGQSVVNKAYVTGDLVNDRIAGKMFIVTEALFDESDDGTFKSLLNIDFVEVIPDSVQMDVISN
ncbi:hypothetical protein EQG49_00355 [Periweissella cryptocerci]|uniref:Uncharacterized protein n=1 Tax=Periweissella cryptocerci TaxID=2506420 RepID=A0A4P6YQY7_9LACO|nr:hypothetical protein [Periweissella cryptocerci]QBO35006.1 hypothetical protein EQG49_00355 [Periweissella cryptocerci]